MKRGTIFIVAAVLAATSLLISACAAAGVELLEPRERIKVATTTSLYDTGLWSHLEPKFEQEHNVEMDILYAGTGIALEWGRRGDVDAITVHAKAQEEQFVAEGYGVQRVPFAYNYFLIVGPSEDPAGIQGLRPEDAFTALMASSSAAFISRGDDSGTHVKEKAIWEAAGYDYEQVQKAGDWYIEAGRGMGPTLLMAKEMQGYTVTDMGTYLAYSGDLDLVPMVEQGEILLNVYSVIAVNPEENPSAHIKMANELVDFLTSSQIQDLIGQYGVGQYGRQLFTPCAGLEPTN